MKYLFRVFLVIFLIQLVGKPLYPQRFEKTRILFLLDASGSMLGKWKEKYKWEAARRLLINMADSLDGVENVELALRVYGHQFHRAKQNCQDTKLEVPFSRSSGEDIINTLKGIRPKGTTPIAYSLTRAAKDFPQSKNSKNVLILITDGIEECKGDPCAVSVALQKRAIVLKPFIIGLGISDRYKKKFDCVGRYYNAKDEKEFKEVMGVVVSQALNTTTAQVNLLDVKGEATETDVNMTFYDAENGIIKYNFYHTMNDVGVPDTLNIDPVPRYNLQVHTTPPVEKKGIELTPGKHNIISLPAPQGSLKLKVEGITGYDNLKCVVKKHNKCKVINIQDFNSSYRYLVGKYDLEILTRPKIHLTGIEIEQSSNTKVEIAQPGKISVYTSQSMLGSIYQMKNNKMEWVCKINPHLRREIIVLQPGNYKLVYRPRISNRSYNTGVKQFKVISGSSTDVNLY